MTLHFIIWDRGQEKSAAVTSEIGFRFLELRKEKPPNEEQLREESESRWCKVNRPW
ncbi:MAG: hypothetical protein OJF51_003130 [Nitrospira sp.]|nr:MAG: hypothetical protein OJF51_003130 [Nitrospira sp.]